VRKDLSESQQAVQGGHALAEFLLHGPNTEWKNGTLIYLGVKGQIQLENLMHKLERRDINFAVFHEPDIGNQPTAIATDQKCEYFEKLNLI
jgi:hypothetical protein